MISIRRFFFVVVLCLFSIVVYSDYTYSDFVGQILPQTDGEKISYPFTEGPFTTILRKAIHDPDNMYYLVIEEINRGNAPAIFGEVFQLLDRENGVSNIFRIYLRSPTATHSTSKFK